MQSKVTKRAIPTTASTIYIIRYLFSSKSFDMFRFNYKNIEVLMIYFIRHGQSTYNLAEPIFEKKLREKHGEEFKKTADYPQEIYNKQLLDGDLTELGQKQCLQAVQQVLGLDVDLIITSPLRRALRTCDILFKNHKNKPPIVVYPQFRQIFYASVDIGSKLLQSEKIFDNFDYSRIFDKKAWFIHELAVEQHRKELLKKVEHLQGKEKVDRATDEMINFLQTQILPQVIYHPQKRQAIFQTLLPSEQKQRQILKQLSKKNKNIAVVAHNLCIKRYSKKELKNCQVFHFNTAKL